MTRRAPTPRKIITGTAIIIVLAVLAVTTLRWGLASLHLWRAEQTITRLNSQEMSLTQQDSELEFGLDHLQNALELAGDHPDLFDLLGQYRYWQAMNRAEIGTERAAFLEQAVADYRRSLALRPLWPYTWANLVVAKAEWGIFDPEFRRAVRRTAETGPREPRVQLQLIRVDFQEQDRIDQRSRRHIQRMMDRALETQPGAVLALAQQYRQLARICPMIENTHLLRTCERAGWVVQ